MTSSPRSTGGWRARPSSTSANSDQLGLFVVSRLAVRHSIKVSLRQSAYGGTTAILLLPFGVIVRAEDAGWRRPDPAANRRPAPRARRRCRPARAGPARRPRDRCRPSARAYGTGCPRRPPAPGRDRPGHGGEPAADAAFPAAVGVLAPSGLPATGAPTTPSRTAAMGCRDGPARGSTPSAGAANERTGPAAPGSPGSGGWSRPLPAPAEPRAARQAAPRCRAVTSGCRSASRRPAWRRSCGPRRRRPARRRPVAAPGAGRRR